VIVLDTSVLSRVLGRSPRLVGRETPEEAVFRGIVSRGMEFRVPGVVLQEFLTGARSPEQAARLRGLAEHLPIDLATADDHRSAAAISNECRWNGVATDLADCLIAAQTIRLRGALFTLDRDFDRMASCCDLKLWRVER
jgi:predicted nucleic acid-binding protein